jgi:hypothetical protein
MNSYDLSRVWFDWAFENPDLVNTNDTALYMWLIEKNNRCGWSEKFSTTSTESMSACGFKTYPPYKKSFDKLVEYGFVLIVKKSINQFQTNVIALSKNNKATNKALDKASLKQPIKHIKSNRESTFDINKQTNNETIKPINNKYTSAKKIKIEKLKFGEFENVLLTGEEFKISKEKYKEDLEPMIEKLSSYIQSSGKTYKSHYATFSSWVYNSIIEEKQKQQKNAGRETKTDYLKRVGGELDDIFKRKEQTGNYFGIDLTGERQRANDDSGYSDFTNVS